jgi:hypothetical protein
MNSRFALVLLTAVLTSCGGDDDSIDESLMMVNVSQYLEAFNPGGPSRVVVTLPGAVAFRLTQLTAVGASYEGPACAGYRPGAAPGPGSPDAAGFVGYALVVRISNPLHRSAAQAVGFEQMSAARQQALSQAQPCADLGLT